MDKTKLGLAGIVSSLVALPAMAIGSPAPATPAVPQAQSFAELLEPIPNAVGRLQAADAQEAVGTPRLIKAQWYWYHHRRYRRHHHHHHHHHHHNY